MLLLRLVVHSKVKHVRLSSADTWVVIPVSVIFKLRACDGLPRWEQSKRYGELPQVEVVKIMSDQQLSNRKHGIVPSNKRNTWHSTDEQGASVCRCASCGSTVLPHST